MQWPNIFFKARRASPDSALPPPFKPAPESPKPAPVKPQPQPQPPAIKPVPAALGPQAATPAPLKAGAMPMTTSTRTLPAMHGVVLRPPDRLAKTTSTMKIAPLNAAPTGPPPARPASPMKNIEQLMAEADPVHTLRQTGSIRLLKRLTPETASIKALTETPAQPSSIKPETNPSTATTPPSEPIAAALPAVPWTPPPFPAFQAAAAPLPLETK